MLQFPRIVGWMLVGAAVLSLVVLAPAAAQVVCSEPLMAGTVCNTPLSPTPGRLAAAESGGRVAGQRIALSLSSLGASYAARQPSSLGTGYSPSGQYQATTTYTVVLGDNLYRISLRFGTTVRAITQANPSIVDPNRIYAGQVLVIPIGSATATPVPGGYTAVPQPTAAAGTTQYTVVRGDNLYRISLRFGTTVQAIMQANPSIVDPNRIYAGQVLVIPSGATVVAPTPTLVPAPTSTATPVPATAVPFPTETIAPAATAIPTAAPTSPLASPTAEILTPVATETATAPVIGVGTPAATAVGVGTPVATAGPTSSTSTLASTSPTSVPATPAPGQPVATINLTARNIAFDPTSITVPGSAHVVINFSNQDPVPHNFALYTNNTAQQVIFRGQVITGPNATATYEFTAPSQPGTYFFRCDIHPAQMMGQFVVQ